ncbi:TonB-dependent receptor [Dyadobacter pollutisoli]|uniref:TonB-dependent receptor n=1 Tax=Dyadobacter pollutisoli TaxID=2910158 RepID=A0A9E8NDJ4_9BACT|nr:TonB-dependent receptor [Dyadobacter pollutisoli]WAC13026.1 TonB-dependent receptor [Dyadobacter pollutisoli]
MKKGYNYQLLLRFMRISLFQFVIAACLMGTSWAREGNAQTLLAKKISLNVQNVEIGDLLHKIEKLTNAKFVYSAKVIQAHRKVTVKVEQQPVFKVLDETLPPLNLKYRVSDELIIISRIQQDEPIVPEANGPEVNLNGTYKGKSASIDRTITGTVTGDNKELLPGVSVVLKGTQRGTTTDTEGKYSLVIPDEMEATLVFSFVGSASKEVAVGSKTVVDVTLESDTKALNEVVVVGYGTAKKKDLTGAVAIVNVSELQQQPTSQITSQLQGRASGVTVLGSGQPGEAPQIRIRGINTFGNNAPLYVVDGVPTQNINDINPNDVATMQVLKDAGSASIYGSRAANGVIIITTKRGSGKIKIQYDAYVGTQRPQGGNVWNLLNPQETAQLKFNALRNVNPNEAIADPLYGSGQVPVLPDYIAPQGAKEGDASVDPSLYNVNPNYTNTDAYNSFYRIVRANKSGTDWFHEVFKPASIQSHNLAVSGGGNQGNYLISFNYFNQQGTLMNTYLKRYTIRSNSQFNVNERIRIGENLAFSVSDNPRVNSSTEGSAIGMSFRQQPIIPVYDIMGNYGGGYGQGLGNAKNPVAIQDRTRNNSGQSNRLFGNVYAEMDLLKDLTLRSSFGGELYSAAYRSFAYPEYENQENLTVNSYTENAFSGFNWTWSNTLNYEHTFSDIHSVKVLVGIENYKNRGSVLGGTTTGYFNFDPNFTTLTTGSGTPTNYSARFKDGLASLIGRVDYALMDKYLIGATIRRDGSSRFKTYRYGWFPAVSAGWRVSKEKFMENISWINDLKFRGGYGVMGNQLNVDAANAYTTYGQDRTSSFYDIAGSNQGTIMGLQRTRIGNPDAKWERNINSNVGIDASLFRGKLDLTVDYYRKEIRDLLYNPELAASAGLGTVPFVNIARMRNQGIDLSASTNVDVSNDLKLNATVTFTTYNNKIISLTDGVDYFDQEGRRFNGSFIVRNSVGHSIGQFFGYKTDGFWDSQEEINTANAQARQATGNSTANYQADVAVGRFRYADTNGDGVITPEDRTYLGNPNPKFSYGINLGANYKGFDASIFLYGSQGNDIWNNVKWWTDFNSNFQGAKSHTALYDSWTPDNPNASAPIQETVGSFSTSNVPNSYFVEKGSYLRAKNAQIGYTFPSGMLKKIKIEKLRLYVQAANLFTITKYSGLDPEIGTTSNTNNTSGGSSNQSFATTTSFGIDEGVYPNQRQFLLGLNLTF